MGDQAHREPHRPIRGEGFSGRVHPLSSFVVPSLLLTTAGRRSGRERTVPQVYLRDGDRFVVANARPAGERRNPWILNLRAAGEAQVRLGGRKLQVTAEELAGAAVDRWWPLLVDVWPAFDEHYTATGERTVFLLAPTTPRSN
ncbi:MAG: nitroreductase family deazaflavin-dependent oxidoreductase [bacterium]|nr:nitroreductase family deazaflavin-dependent oxidoreductase [bacterium]